MGLQLLDDDGSICSAFSGFAWGVFCVGKIILLFTQFKEKNNSATQIKHRRREGDGETIIFISVLNAANI